MFELADGDKMPFHVTDGFFSRADGKFVIPPVLIHSAGGKTEKPVLTREHLAGIFDLEGNSASGIDVEVTTNGSMTRALFPWAMQHFIDHLPAGQGKDGDPVFLFLDGHTSRWSLTALAGRFASGMRREAACAKAET